MDLLLPDLLQVTPGVSEDGARRWVAAVLAVIETPADLTGVLLAESALHFLVDYFLREPVTLPDRLPRLILSVLFAELRHHPDRSRFLQRPPQEHAELFTFHIDASRAGGARDEPCLLYQLWVPWFHLGLRSVQGTTEAQSTVKSYTTPARRFFDVFPHTRLKCLPRRPTKRLFESHVTLYIRARPDLGEKAAKSHRDCLLRLFEGHRVRPHPHAGADVSSSPRKAEEGVLIEQEELDDAPTSATTKSLHVAQNGRIDLDIVVENTFHLECAETGGMDPEFHATEYIYPFPRQQRVVPRPPSLQYDQINRYILHQFPFWWDRVSVALYQLITLYQFVASLLAEPGASGIALFLLLLFMTGRPPRELAQTCIGTYPAMPGADDGLPRDRLLMDVDQKWLFFFQSKGRSSFKPKPGSGWLLSSPWVAFPIPRPLLPVFDQYVSWLRSVGELKAGHLFFRGSSRSSSVRELTPDLVKTIMMGTPHADLLPSPAHLASAFLPLMVHGFGLDEAVARLISGRGVKGGYAPLHYTRTVLTDLFGEYEAPCAALHASVITHLPGSGWWTVLSLSACASPPGDLAVGSPVLRTEEAARELVTAIVTVVTGTGKPRKAEDIVLHHNAYCALCYLLLLYLGVRPRNKLPWTRHDVASGATHLLIADKQSNTWFEQRLLLLPPLVDHTLLRLGTGHCRLKQALRSEFGSVQADALPDDLFFFLGKDGMPVPFSLQTFWEIVRGLVPSFPAEAPDNEGRHRVRTALFKDGLAADLIDAWLGHTRGGREPLARHSSTLYGPAMVTLRDWLQRYLHDLGFRELAYFPTYEGGPNG